MRWYNYIEWLFFLIAFVGVIKSIKTNNPLLLGESIFILWGISFFYIIYYRSELIEINKKINKLQKRAKK